MLGSILFSDIGPYLAANIPNSILDINFPPDPNIPKFELTETTNDIVTKLLMSISSTNGRGCDEIPVKSLKCNLDNSGEILCHIINMSISTGIVPSGWKIGVVPLFEAGDRSSPEMYRPISILPSGSKLLEKVIHKQVYAFLQHHSLFLKAQFGFRKGHSTNFGIFHLMDVIYRNIDIGLFTIARTPRSGRTVFISMR